VYSSPPAPNDRRLLTLCGRQRSQLTTTLIAAAGA